MSAPARDWLDVMEREYLADFIPHGGGAVRFAVADADDVSALGDALAGRAEARGLHAARVDLARTRLHMLQNVVFAVADALPWEAMLDARVRSLLDGAGYRWPEAGAEPLLPALAEANGVAGPLVQRAFSQALTREVWRDARLTADFRNAMIALLEARLVGDDAAAEPVMSWLRGTLRATGPLRQAQVGRKIGRQNARATLASLCVWVRSCGGAGIALLIDIRQLHRERRDAGDGLLYTPAAVMDCYEVLRQLIDETESLPGLFVAALADPALVSDDPRRSLGQYTALQMRVWDDVRPLGGDNLLAPLVRLAR